jgi:hypothetical protein
MTSVYQRTKEEMDELKKEEKVEVVLPKCQNCGIPMEGRKKRYCSKKCNCQHWNKLHKLSKGE